MNQIAEEEENRVMIEVEPLQVEEDEEEIKVESDVETERQQMLYQEWTRNGKDVYGDNAGEADDEES